MPRPTGQQQMHSHPQRYGYPDPYSSHPGRNVFSRRGHPRALHHHPYARPEHSSPPSYDYYYNDKRMISPPHSTVVSPQQDLAAAVAAETKKKKPPRPYTEYNIFFQLERDRILMELEDKKNEEEAEEAGEEPRSSPRELILNQPSDENDILPRPAQFAHLKLEPKWYDSVHRIAQNKANKSKRKHRKTHGLVGFLDLTKMISKAWANADEETKSYCKRVADRQLGYYKEELKAIKECAQQEQEILMEKQQAARSMHPHDSQGFYDRVPIHHRSSPPQYWHHHTMSPPHEIHDHSSLTEQFPQTPTSHETFIEDQLSYNRHARSYRPSGKMHPLEELMLRRKMYGSNRGKDQGVWSPSGPSRMAGTMLPHTNSYISPTDTGLTTKEAVTPSPRKKDPSSPALPMRKRMTKEGPFSPGKGGSPESNGSSDILESGTHTTSPFSTSFPSPTEMMNHVLNGSPISTSSYHKALGPYLSDSPMPYMDFSPQESIGSPQRPRQMAPTKVPSHLTLPGSYGITSVRSSHQRKHSNPYSGDLADDILDDFDEEEMDYMWNKLASSARARRQAKAAAAEELFRMSHDAIKSPGTTNALGLAHSFASPAAPVDNKVLSPSTAAVRKAPPLPPVDEKEIA